MVDLPLACGPDCQLCLDKLCMQKVPIFADLAREDLETIARRILHRSVPRGTVILSAGDRADAITIVNTGKVKASRYSEDGKEQIVYLFSEGDFFGEHGLFHDEAAPYQLEALTDVRLCQLFRTDFQDLLKAHPNIALQVLTALSKRLHALEKTLGSQSLDSRVQALLLEFAEKYGRRQAGGLLVRLPLSREGIASYLGVARETVSRKFSQLELDGVIRAIGHKNIQILDLDALQANSKF